MFEKILIEDWGDLDYHEALILQKQKQLARINGEISDTVAFVEHPSIYTIGRDLIDKDALIKDKLPAPLHFVNRGGKITYHGPGQLVVYFFCKVAPDNVGGFVNMVEDLAIKTAKYFGADVYTRKNERDSYGKNIRGAWVDVDEAPRKIAALGLSFSKEVSMHGLSFNVNTDMGFYDYINPCGFSYRAATSLQEIGEKDISMSEVKVKVREILNGWRTSYG